MTQCNRNRWCKGKPKRGQKSCDPCRQYKADYYQAVGSIGHEPRAAAKPKLSRVRITPLEPTRKSRQRETWSMMSKPAKDAIEPGIGEMVK